MKQRQSDPIINEVPEVGHRISARLDHGPARLVAFYLEMQKQHHQRLTREHGHPKLLQHLAGVMALMRVASGWDVFRRSMDRAYSRFGKTIPLNLSEPEC